MGPDYHKHYIRVDAQGRITYGYSDAFEAARDGDLCINEAGGYQFRLTPDGEENPMLTTPYGVPLYRWDPAEGAVRRSEKEVAADVAALPAPGAAITAEQEQLAALMLRQAQNEAAQQQFNADILLAMAQAQGGGEMSV